APILDPVRVIAVPRPRGRAERMARTGRLVVRAGAALDADIYHLHDPELLLWTQGLRLRGKRVIFDMHENLPGALLDKPWVTPALRRPLSALSRAAERLLIREMPVVFAEDSYRPLYPWVTNATTVLNLPDVARIAGYQQPRRAHFTVGYVGGVAPVRGSLLMLEALGLLKREGLDVGFVCIGPMAPTHKQQLEQRIAELGLLNVQLHGRLRQEEALPLIASCHVGLAVLQDRPNYRGSYPTKMFEYMALGLPVVVSDFPLYRGVVESEGCGFCVNPLDARELANALRLLHDYPALGVQMGERGAAAAFGRYNWDSEERKLLAFYEQVLA
ncbi:MAG: glycosyltransferase, partial [Caldilineaceae bacterium]